MVRAAWSGARPGSRGLGAAAQGERQGHVAPAPAPAPLCVTEKEARAGGGDIVNRGQAQGQ